MAADSEDNISLSEPTFHMTEEEEAIYERITQGIRVSVSPHYMEDQSDPDEPRYVWAYTVRIDNESNPSPGRITGCSPTTPSPVTSSVWPRESVIRQ